jgi:hypothetical protein
VGEYRGNLIIAPVGCCDVGQPAQMRRDPWTESGPGSSPLSPTKGLIVELRPSKEGSGRHPPSSRRNRPRNCSRNLAGRPRGSLRFEDDTDYPRPEPIRPVALAQILFDYCRTRVICLRVSLLVLRVGSRFTVMGSGQ